MKASRPAGWEWAAGVVLAALAGACASQSPSGNPPPAAAVTPTPLASAAPAATPRPPVPAARVPDQPYVGTPRPVEQPYLEILRLKNDGLSNEELLAKVQRENVAYSLSTFDIQKLRASGISQEVIAAMLSSGRAGRRPTPAPPETPTPRGS